MFRRLVIRMVKTEHLLIALWELKHDRSRNKNKVKAELFLARELVRRNVKFWV